MISKELIRAGYTHGIVQTIDNPINALVHTGEKSYQSRVKIVPTRHDYGDGYYKYSCPLCALFGLKHQVTHGEDRCFCCGVNFCWDE